MGSFPADVVEIAAVKGKFWLLAVKFIQGFVGDGEQFRSLKARGRRGLDPGGGDGVGHGLRTGNAGVLVAAALGIVGEAVKKDAERFIQLHIFIEGFGGRSQLPLVRRQTGNQFPQVCQLGFPALIAWEQVLNGP